MIDLKNISFFEDVDDIFLALLKKGVHLAGILLPSEARI